jgi:hypothetical protein
VALAQDQGDEARLLEQRVAELLDTALKGGRFVAP